MSFDIKDTSGPSEEYWEKYFNDRFDAHITALKENARIEYERKCKDTDNMDELAVKEARSLNVFNFPIIQRNKVKIAWLRLKIKQHLIALGIGLFMVSFLYIYALAITKGWIK